MNPVLPFGIKVSDSATTLCHALTFSSSRLMPLPPPVPSEWLDLALSGALPECLTTGFALSCLPRLWYACWYLTFIAVLSSSHRLGPELSSRREVRTSVECRKERGENWACAPCPSSQLLPVTCSFPTEMKNTLAHETGKARPRLPSENCREAQMRRSLLPYFSNHPKWMN